MNDPYVLESGTLRNLLNIEDYNELKQAEADIGFGKLINVSSTFSTTFDSEYYKNIHKHIFSDIFEWAGEYRTVPIYKEEVVIPGLSLEYTKPDRIGIELDERIDDLNRVDWSKFKDRRQLSQEFARKLAMIWRVHPFRDGNTRTTLAFADMYSRIHGFPFNMEFLLDNLSRKVDENGRITNYSIRDFFVLAALDDNNYPEPEHLARMFDRAIEIGKLPNLQKNDELER